MLNIIPYFFSRFPLSSFFFFHSQKKNKRLNFFFWLVNDSCFRLKSAWIKEFSESIVYTFWCKKILFLCFQSGYSDEAQRCFV